MAEPFSVDIRFNPTSQMEKILRVASGGDQVVIGKVIDRWRVIYGKYIFDRFNKYARGGGDWPPLAESTVKRKRRNKNLILVHTGALRIGLFPARLSLHGLRQDNGKFTVTATYVNNRTDVMEFHQEGEGGLPKREIVVEPDARTKREMSVEGKKILLENTK